MSARVMGLDIALNRTGVAMPDGTTWTSKGEGPTAKGPDRRLARLFDDLSDAVGTSRPTHLIVEDLPTTAKGAGYTGQAQGVARLVAQLYDNIPIASVVPSTLKKWATGSGVATKEQMWGSLPDTWWLPKYGYDKEFDDEVDAWWLRNLGLAVLSGGRALVPGKWKEWGL